MSQVAKLFANGRSQAVRLPAAYRFDTQEVYIRQDPDTGDVILSRKPTDWDDFFTALNSAEIPADFLTGRERLVDDFVDLHVRDPFQGWDE